MAVTCTEDTLARDLQALGVAAGDLLFMHSSFKSLGAVEGGAAAVIGALERAIAPDGLLLLPSFNLVANEKRLETWNIATTPSTVGYLTEFFRQMPGTQRSDHYSHAVAARGPGAEEFVNGHREMDGYDSPWDKEPYGKAFGTHSPMLRAYQRNGKLLMLGVDYHSSTYMHLIEVMCWNTAKAKDPAAEYYWINREKLGEYWDEHGTVNRGKVSQADCRLCHIRDFVDTLFAEVSAHPELYFKWYPGA